MKRFVQEFWFPFALAAMVILLVLVFSGRSWGEEVDDKTLIAQLAAENMQLRAKVAQLEIRLGLITKAPATKRVSLVCENGVCRLVETSEPPLAADPVGECGAAAGAVNQRPLRNWYEYPFRYRLVDRLRLIRR